MKKGKEGNSVLEEVDEGVTRSEAKQTPMDLMQYEEKEKSEGDWKKATYAEIVKAEAEGRLKGVNPATMEAIIKEK